MPSPFGDPLCWLFPPPLSLLDELVGRVMRKNGTMSGPDFFFFFCFAISAGVDERSEFFCSID